MLLGEKLGGFFNLPQSWVALTNRGSKSAQKSRVVKNFSQQNRHLTNFKDDSPSSENQRYLIIMLITGAVLIKHIVFSS